MGESKTFFYWVSVEFAYIGYAAKGFFLSEVLDVMIIIMRRIRKIVTIVYH